MTSGSLGLRTSGSYGSLQQHSSNGGILLSNQTATTPPINARKTVKMSKDKDKVYHWFLKFAPRKKVGMLLLCAVSALVFGWVLYVGKDEQEGDRIQSMGINDTLDLNYPGYLPTTVDEVVHKESNSLEQNNVRRVTTQPPPPPAYFTGYTLPPGNPCENFALPPPPADKKRTGPRPCPVCYLPVEEATALMPKAPSFSPVLRNLTYIYEENLTRSEFGGSEFGGYPSLKQRSDSYDVRESMSVHCGFVRGTKPGRRTGFDLDDSDLFEMDQCRGVVVASAIFGAYDLIQQPKNISETAKENVCFFMFVDEETEAFLRNSSELNSSKKLGLWRIVVIHNLPYDDPRRNGKNECFTPYPRVMTLKSLDIDEWSGISKHVPKLLLHRLFPNARYSLWIDGKLQLVVDPYQILERFLWRKNASFAISRHYKRFDVFIEAEANKAASKYDNASIDFQVDFYRREGLTPYTVAKLPITSDVPEGCVIIKEHVPISNLLTCLWFNEVDRFTSRDQISFSTARDKIASKTNWTINMFLDCERRNFVVQGYHRDVLEHWAPPPPPGSYSIRHPLPPSPTAVSIPHPPPLVVETQNKTLSETPRGNNVATKRTEVSSRRGRNRKSGSRRNRKVAAGSRDNS